MITEAAGVTVGVLRCGDLAPDVLAYPAERYGLQVNPADGGNPIPGSYWGAPEAGLTIDGLHYVPDTPVHSFFHELAHWVCMTPVRRARLDTDAGGDDVEEVAVCYLQVTIAEVCPTVGSVRMLADMDLWGYSFRLGSARDWYEEDALDARCWLLEHGLMDGEHRPTWRVRGAD